MTGLKPQLGGAEWRTLFTPERTVVYANHHCVVQAPNGSWHVSGITKTAVECFNLGARAGGS